MRPLALAPARSHSSLGHRERIELIDLLAEPGGNPDLRREQTDLKRYRAPCRSRRVRDIRSSDEAATDAHARSGQERPEIRGGRHVALDQVARGKTRRAYEEGTSYRNAATHIEPSVVVERDTPRHADERRRERIVLPRRHSVERSPAKGSTLGRPAEIQTAGVGR